MQKQLISRSFFKEIVKTCFTSLSNFFIIFAWNWFHGKIVNAKTVWKWMKFFNQLIRLHKRIFFKKVYLVIISEKSRWKNLPVKKNWIKIGWETAEIAIGRLEGIVFPQLQFHANFILHAFMYNVHSWISLLFVDVSLLLLQTSLSWFIVDYVDWKIKKLSTYLSICASAYVTYLNVPFLRNWN